jgi:hypothetical protein
MSPRLMNNLRALLARSEYLKRVAPEGRSDFLERSANEVWGWGAILK